MTPSTARLALQVGLIFCLLGAVVGLSAELATTTIIMRALVCGLVGAGLGAGLGSLGQWLRQLVDTLPELPPAPEPQGLPAGDADATALPQPEPATALNEGPSGG